MASGTIFLATKIKRLPISLPNMFIEKYLTTTFNIK